MNIFEEQRVRSRVDFSLPEKLDCHFAGRCKTAFTLAEVLITLGIIGIVAAMTLPSLIQKHQERVTVNKVKKFYSVMSQAQLMAIKDHGYLDEWDVQDGQTKEGVEKFMNYFKPYLKVVKDCGTSSGCLKYSSRPTRLNGETLTNYDIDPNYYKLIMNDGTYMWIRTANGVYGKVYDGECAICFIDVNGKNPPNTLGIDIFDFQVNKNSIRTLNDICSLESDGGGCAGWILEKGNMDYLKK